ncbi:MAG: hypothetical protein KDD67_01505 [Ignavibacteriae bacterium]|nr:hypothetical protein [Ignavibacteriota bacterium]MCB9215506.1 hypothetical protein [Ignavibacteria bacterium]
MTSSTKVIFLKGLGIVVLLIWSGCSDRLPVEPAPSVIMPLAKGNMWIGKLTTFAEDGSVVSTMFDTIEVRAERTITTVGGVSTWYLCDDLAEDGELWYTNESSGLQLITGDGLDALANGGDGCGCHYLNALYPAERGDTSGSLPKAKVLLPNPDDPANPLVVDQITAYYVEAVDTATTVPLGSYRCNVYHLKILAPLDARFINAIPWYYLAPDTGPVKIEWYEGGSPETGRMTKQWELVHVELH